MKRHFRLMLLALATCVIANSTTAQTLLKEINTTNGGANGAQPGEITRVEELNLTFFRANDNLPGTNFELWRTNGTAAGTQQVKNINPVSGFPANLTNIGGTLIFSANNGTDGIELWRSNGTDAGTVQIANINPGAANSNPESFVRWGTTNNFYFFAEGPNGKELYSSSITGSSATLVKDINTAAGVGSNPAGLVFMNNKLYFAASDGTNGLELWTSDGTASGTVMLKDINPSGSSSPTDLTVMGNLVFFAADNGTDGKELWVTNGTAAGTQQVVNINTGSGIGSNPSNFMALNGVMYFTADNGSGGLELWKTDGTAANTSLIDINPGAAGSSPSELTVVGTQLYFAATTSSVGRELYRYDGSNFFLVKNIDNASTNSAPEQLTHAFGQLYFSATTPAAGREFYRTDGTDAGTVLVSDLNSGVNSSDPRDFSILGSNLLFFADNGTIGQELYSYTMPNTPVISPIANQSTNESTTISNITFSVNSTAGVGGLTVTAFSLDQTLVANAGVVVSGSGTNRSLSVTPVIFQNGVANIVVQVCDNSANCVRDTFALTIIPVQDAPVVSNFSVNVNEDNDYTFSLTDWTDAFTDPENGLLDTIRLKTLPSNGQLFLGTSLISSAPRGIQRSRLTELRFSPDTNYNGTVTMIYEARSGTRLSSNDATVTINVNAVNDVPVIISRVAVTTNEDVLYTFSATNFSSNTVYTDQESDALAAIRITFLPLSGFLIDNNDTLNGSLLPRTITAANIANLKYAPAQHFNGQVRFRYAAGDGQGFSNIDTAFINITAVNDLPVGAGFNVSFNEDEVYTFAAAQFQAGYSDVENTPLQAVRIVNIGNNITLKQGANTVNIGQEIALANLATLNITPDLDWNGTSSIEFRVKDNADLSAASYLVNITVNPVNDAPIAGPVSLNGVEDTDIALAASVFSGAFSNTNFGETDVFSGIQVVSLPANASVKLNGAAITVAQLPFNVSLAQMAQLAFSPALHFNGTTSFTYKTFDGAAYSTQANSVTVTLSAVNDNPEAFGFVVNLLEDNTYSFLIKDFTDNFVDVDNDTLLRIRVLQVPAQGALTVASVPVSANTDISRAAIATMVYAPLQNFEGRDYFTYQSFDPSLAISNIDTVFIDVVPVNDAPVVSTINLTTDEDVVLSFFENNFTSAYTDEENNALTTIRIASNVSAGFGILRQGGTVLTNGSIINRNNINNMTFTPAPNFSGVVSILYQANDGALNSNTDTILITVNAVNDGPTISGPASITAVEDVLTNVIGFGFNDIDAGAASSLTVTLDVTKGLLNLSNISGLNFAQGDGNSDSVMTFTGNLGALNTAMGGLSYLGDQDYNGFDRLRISISDNGNTGLGGAIVTTRDVNIEVTGVNDTALLVVPVTQQAIDATPLLINGISITDLDNFANNYRVSLSVLHGRLSLSGITGLVFEQGTGSGNRSMVFSGSLTFINPALNNLQFVSDSNFTGLETINITVIDSINQNLNVLTDNAQVQVNVAPRPVTFAAQPQARQLCESSPVTFSVQARGTAPYTYQWFFNNDTIVGATNSSYSISSISAANQGTYYCAVGNAGGVVNSNNAVLTVYDKPDADFNFTQACSNQPITFTNTTALTGTTVSEYVWNMGDGASYSLASPTHTFGSTNVFPVSMRVLSNQGCRDTVVKNITVIPSPVASFTAANVCFGDSIATVNSSSVFAGNLTYLWTIEGQTYNTATPKHLFASPGNKTISLTATNNGVCSTSSTAQVVVSPRPTVNFTVNNICLGDDAQFTNASTITSGGLNYSWNFGNGSTSSNVSPAFRYNQADTFNVKLVAESNNACRDSISKSIIVYPVPNAMFASSNICAQDSVSFNNTTTVALGGVNYNWTFGDGTSSNLSSPVKDYNVPGAYNVKMIATGIFGCKDSMQTVVNVYHDPVVDFSFDNVCRGTAMDFTNNTTIGSGTISYQWNFGDLTTSTNINPAKNYSAPGDYNVRLNATSDRGCLKSVTKSVRVYPQPIAGFNAADVCADSDVMFNNSATVQAGGIITTWSLGNGADTMINSSFAYRYPMFGTYQVKQVVVADSGCADSLVRTIQVFAEPVVDFEFNNVCRGTIVDFVNNSTVAAGTVGYTWNFGDATASTNNNPSKLYNNDGLYNVSLSARTDRGCTESVNKAIRIYPQPVASFSVANVCENVAVSVVNNYSISNGGVANIWTFGDGSTTINNSSFQYPYAGFGNYTITQVVVADSGCADTASAQVNVFAMPNVNFAAQDVCLGETINFFNQSSIANGILVYNWNFGDGTGTQNVSPTKQFSVADTFGVTLVATSNNGCVDSLNRAIVVKPFPVVGFSATNVCFGDSTTFTNTTTSTKGAITYNWNLGNGSPSVTTPSFKNLYASSGTYIVKMVATAAGGCADSLTRVVSVYDVATLGVTGNNVACNNVPTGSVSVSVNGGTAPFQYSINGGQAYQSSNQFNGLAAGSFNIQVLDFNGCLSVFGQNPFSLSQPPALALSQPTIADVSCFGGNNGSVVASAQGGTIPYSFNLNNGGFQSSGTFNSLQAGLYLVNVTDANGCTFSTNANVSQPATPITANVTFTNLICRDDSSGTITVNASGSVGGYTYSINNGNTFQAGNVFANLAAGGYTVIATDTNGCTTQQGVALTQPATSVDLSLLQTTDVRCFGELTGVVSLVGVGGTGAKQYSLNNTSSFQTGNVFANLAAGSYMAYATDFNGCLDSISFAISQPASAIRIDSVLSQNVRCFGESNGRVEVFASGGVPGYRYSADNGNTLALSNLIQNLVAGNYNVLVADANNCQAVSQVTLNQPDLLEVSIDNIDNETCENDGSGAVTLSGLGGAGAYQFSINSGAFQSAGQFNNLSSGSYTAIIRDGNACTTQDQFEVMADILQPVADFRFQQVANAVVFINQSTDAVDYSWNFGDGNGSTDENPSHLYNQGGIYEVILVASNQCGDDTLSRFVNLNATGIEAVSGEAFVQVYPNPSNGIVSINIANSNEMIEDLRIVDLSGKVVYSETSPAQSNEMLDLTGLAAGIYQLELHTATKTLTTKLIIK